MNVGVHETEHPDRKDAVGAEVDATTGTKQEADSRSRTESHAATVGRQAGRGLRWALAGTVVGKLGSFVMSLVLARLLVPEDFGLFAIALAATQFAMHVNDMGVIAATVQWRGRVEDIIPTANSGWCPRRAGGAGCIPAVARWRVVAVHGP
jgi:PST family polysaccharide transporter